MDGKKRDATKVRLTKEQYEALREAAFHRRVSHQQALTEGLQLWLHGGASQQPESTSDLLNELSADHQDLVRQLADALRAGADPGYIAIISVALKRMAQNKAAAKKAKKT